MATKSIAWNTGSGNISINYTGEGNGTIEITSDNNNLYEARSQQITVKTTDGSDIQRTITIQQAAKVRIDISTAVVTASNQTYNGSAKTPTPMVTLNGVTVPLTGYDVAYNDNTNAGTATITVTGKNDYTGTATGTFTIAKANPTYTAPTANSLTYNGNSRYLTTTGSTSDGTIQYSENGSSWSTTRVTKTTAGTYTTYWRLVGDSNHNDVESTPITTTINKASRTISFANSYYVQDTSTTTTRTATPSAGSGDGAITYSISSTTYATINSSSGAVTSKTSDGSATVTATIAEGTNYLSASTSYTLYVFATTHNYSYNGSYRSVTLPPGTYQFQCWGAQGGSNAAYSSYGITAKAGGKGGYSVGQLTVSQATGVRVYVGGQGSSSAGGYNGGGSTTGTSQYDNDNWFGYSKMGGGGGATDIRLSDGALLSRMIVAGGGSGGAMCLESHTTTTTTWQTLATLDLSSVTYSTTSSFTWNNLGNGWWCGGKTEGSSKFAYVMPTSPDTWLGLSDGDVIRVSTSSSVYNLVVGNGTSSNALRSPYTEVYNSNTVDWTISKSNDELLIVINGSSNGYFGTITIEKGTTTSSTSTDNYGSTGYAGGGTSGLGYSNSGGKQNSGGTSVNGNLNGSFGQGANQDATAYRHCAGAGGGGWYGGATARANRDYTAPRYSGGGSGWVNTAASSGNRPSGYTGLQLDSGETKAGNTSFPNTAGSGNETGHSGDGYARITRLS